MGGLFYSCNLVYDTIDRRSYVVRKLLTIGLSIIGGVLVIASFLIFGFGQRISEWLDEHTDLSSTFIDILSSGRRWSIVLVACALLLLYWFGPNVEKSIRWTIPGAVMATASIYVVYVGFEYIVRIVNPGSAYGAASSVLILLWSLYLISLIVVIGAQTNAVLGYRYDKKLSHSKDHVDKPNDMLAGDKN
jgi:membrane protein